MEIVHFIQNFPGPMVPAYWEPNLSCGLTGIPNSSSETSWNQHVWPPQVILGAFLEEDPCWGTHHPRRGWWRCHVPHWVRCIWLHQEDRRPLATQDLPFRPPIHNISCTLHTRTTAGYYDYAIIQYYSHLFTMRNGSPMLQRWSGHFQMRSFGTEVQTKWWRSVAKARKG